MDKLEKSDSTLHEGIIRHNLLEPTWDNNWFQPASINQSFSFTSLNGTNVHKSIDHDQSEEVGLLPIPGTESITITSTPIQILAETPNTHKYTYNHRRCFNKHSYLREEKTRAIT